MMSTGGITRMLFFEDQNESFDTQDALDSLLEELKCGDGGDTTSFLSEDDVWIAETVTIPDQVDDSFMKENNGDVSPNQVLENEKSMVKEKELEKEVEKEKKKKKKKHSPCEENVEDESFVQVVENENNEDESLVQVAGAVVNIEEGVYVPVCELIPWSVGDVSPNQVLENEKSMVKEKELEKEVEKEKKKKKKIHSQCVRCSIIQKIMIDGVQRDTGLVIEENIDPFMISMFSKRKCAQCKKILTIFST